MNFSPISQKINKPLLIKCARCGETRSADSFIDIDHFLFPQGYLNICNFCIRDFLELNNYAWEAVDKLCQYLDVPFIPSEWTKVYKLNPENSFPQYVQMFKTTEFDNLNWKIYDEEYRELEKLGLLRYELPLIAENERHKLVERWGGNYDDEDLRYLENLYQGLQMSHNIQNQLHDDQVKKLCKISLEIDSLIREGRDFDKMLASYDKLVKIADLTPASSKNISDFDSVGELFKWLEKRGFKADFYDGVTRDVVDETIKNIQSYNQRLYINETGIGEEITRRMEALQSARELETYYDLEPEYDSDQYEVEGFTQLFEGESNDFQPTQDNDEEIMRQLGLLDEEETK